MSSASRAKSADRIEGTISIIYGLHRFYHTGVETVPGLAAGQPAHLPRNQFYGNRRRDPLVLLRLQRTGRIHQDSSGSERRAGVSEQGRLAAPQVIEIARREPPLDLRIADEGSRARTGCVHQNAVKASGE